MEIQNFNVEDFLVDEDVTRVDFENAVEINLDVDDLSVEKKEEFNRLMDRIYRIFFPIMYAERFFDTKNDDYDTISRKLDEWVMTLAQRFHDQEKDVDLPTHGTIGILTLKRLHQVDEDFDYPAVVEYWVNNSPLIVLWNQFMTE